MNPFLRKFVSEVRRCDELERKLRYIEEEVKRDGVPIPDLTEQPRAPNPREIIDLEVSGWPTLQALGWGSILRALRTCSPSRWPHPLQTRMHSNGGVHALVQLYAGL